MADFTPSFSVDQEAIADSVVALGSLSAEGEIDLTAAYGAFLFLAIGRGGTTANGSAAKWLVRRRLDTTKIHPTVATLYSSLTAATSVTVDGDSAAAQNVLNVSTTVGFARGDAICIQDSGAGVTRLEFARVSKITNAGIGGELVLDQDLQYAHTAAQADTVRNQADIFAPMWLDGGSIYVVVFDHGIATGDSLTVRARYQAFVKQVSA